MNFHSYKIFFTAPVSQKNLITISDRRDIKQQTTRTHSMARHRKCPRSRRNLMVIDPLTPYQGHQFDFMLEIFSVSWSTAHPL